MVLRVAEWRNDIKVLIEQHNILPKLPQPLSWFLGFRAKAQETSPYWARLLSIFLCTMAGMLPTLAVVKHAPLFTDHWHFEVFVPSFAASCVLIYGSIEAPFSQPRNFIFGHFISGLIGICIMKLFMENRDDVKYLWLSAALSVACSSVIMDITETVHPPAGATAIIPSIDSSVRELGWNYLPVLLINICLFLGVALLCNNLVRRYPQYWLWQSKKATPAEVEDNFVHVKITVNEICLPRGVYPSEEDYQALKRIQSKLKPS